MGSRLIAVTGPLAGTTLALGADAVTLGRDRASTLHLRDLAVSRLHCLIEPAGEGFRLRDVDSRHGTFVNGLPVRERDLQPGDRISVGESLFLYQMDSAEIPPQDGGFLEDGSFSAESTILRPADTSLYLRASIEPPPGARAARDLQALLRIGQDLHRLRATEPLARRLLELLLETVPAERAALLLLDRAGEPASAFTLDHTGSAAPFPLSRTLVERVVQERQSALANDVQAAGWNDAESVRSARIQSLLAAPLTGPDGAPGLLYLDTRRDGPHFDETHQELLTAIAGIASVALANTRHMEWLAEEKDRLEEAIDHDLVGEGPRMREIWRLLSRVAPSDSTVLIRGESGTGKEVAARVIHRKSRRANRPFVAINCATLSETLLESELFGHEKGAFTGADRDRIGRFQYANGGTLFLDEIGDMPIAIQVKLLRVLETGTLVRIGGDQPVEVDVRVIAATNRDLEAAIREGAFREDLFYRLNVISLTLPPLRERREDIPLLASHFAARFGFKLGRRVAGFTPEARALLQRYAWPGNVRELSNAVERAIVLGEGNLIRPEDLPETILEAPPGAAGKMPVTRFHETINETKKRLIVGAVEEARGNITKAAELLGLNANYLHRLISNLGLRDQIE